MTTDVPPHMRTEDERRELHPLLERLANRLYQTQAFILTALLESGLTVVLLDESSREVSPVLADRIAELERALYTCRECGSYGPPTPGKSASVDPTCDSCFDTSAGSMATKARLAKLERAAETSRVEHAAALGLATARIRELEEERDELLGLLLEDQPAEDCSFWDMDGCADGKCWHCRRRAIVARIEKATK